VTGHPALLVFLYALVTALATGLGALPFALVRRVSPHAVAYANAIAAGLMLGASFGLVVEGTSFGRLETVIGVAVGVLFILVTQHVLAGREVELADVRGAGAQRMLLIVIVMTVHSFAEGVAVGVSFGGGVTLAAISAVLRPRGATVAACAGWSIFSSLPQPLMAVPAFLFVDAFRAALPYGIGFAAGAMVFMVFVELLPEAFGQARRSVVATLVSLTMVAMIFFQQYL
jgi:zinc transporter ZupT